MVEILVKGKCAHNKVLVFDDTGFICKDVMYLLGQELKDKCPQNQILAYDQPTNSFICRPGDFVLAELKGFRCETGQRVIGFQNSGRPICAGFPKNPRPGPGDHPIIR